MSTSKATYFPNEIKHKGHYYTINKSIFVGNLLQAKKEANTQKEKIKTYDKPERFIVRRFGENVNIYECAGL